MGMGMGGNGNGFMGMEGNGNRNSPSHTPLIERFPLLASYAAVQLAISSTCLL